MNLKKELFLTYRQSKKKVLELYKSEASKENPVKVQEYLTKYTNDFARASIHKYWELGDKFWTMFARGF